MVAFDKTCSNRINVIRLELPALRERRDDIPVLVEHFLQIAAKEFGREIESFTPSAMQILCNHRWPGNIRGLENVVQRAVLLTKKPMIDCDLLPSSMTHSSGTQVQGMNIAASTAFDGSSTADSVSNSPSRSNSIPPCSAVSLSEALEEPERRIILDTLKARNWNRNERHGSWNTIEQRLQENQAARNRRANSKLADSENQFF